MSSINALIGREIIEEIVYIVNRLSRYECLFRFVDVFVFGSILKRKTPHSDIDILVLYHTEQDLKQVRTLFKELNLDLPLDVIFLCLEEEAELDFINSQRCVKIYPS